MLLRFLSRSALIVGVSLYLSACGDDRGSKKKSAPLGPTASAFFQTAQKHRIPQEILMALVYKESGIDTNRSLFAYQDGQLSKGPTLAETAVGLSAQTLGLSGADSPSLASQLDAYGAWVQANLEQQHLSLPQLPAKNDDIYDWIWQLARMHHGGDQASKNVQIIFALELLQTLNEGFLWQDPASKEQIQLEPRNPKLDPNSFSAPIQANLKLDTRTSELFFVDYLQLSYNPVLGQENEAKSIKVIHCPFSLSTCLGDQLQNTQAEGKLPLEAHYIIPEAESILSNPIKILQHKAPVHLLDAAGQRQLSTDSIVIMLTGKSGRYYQDQRFAANPAWYSRSQLRNLRKMVAGVCELLQREQIGFDLNRCRSLYSGVQFQVTAPKSSFKFGDIPDFDSKIFGSFILNPDDLSGELSVDLPNQQKLFPAGSPIQAQLNFIKGTAKIEVQLLERCINGKTIWTNIQTHFLRNATSKLIDLTLFDQGPNRNGQQFVRALAYDNQGKLMGWATKDFFLAAYDSEGTPLPDTEACRL